jgi:hypothetical protein
VYDHDETTPGATEDIRHPEVRGYVTDFTEQKKQCSQNFDVAHEDNEACGP